MYTQKIMKAKKRQKLCHNCEGNIDLDVIVCPYCAADLREERLDQRAHTMTRPLHSEEEMSHSLYPVHAPPEREETASPLPSAPQEEAVLKEPTGRNPIGPILLFAVGVQLLMLGLLLVLFSHRGVVLLKWDARLWFLYLFASVPFLVFGYRSLSKL